MNEAVKRHAFIHVRKGRGREAGREQPGRQARREGEGSEMSMFPHASVTVMLSSCSQEAGGTRQLKFLGY